MSDAIVSYSELKPLPLGQRRKGMTMIGSGFDFVLRALDYVGDGELHSDFRQYLKRENPRLKESSVSLQSAVLRHDLRVLVAVGDRVEPTDLGRKLIETRDPTCLAPHLLTGFVGLDHLIDALRLGQRLTKKELVAKLKVVHPSWTSNFAPDAQIRWFVTFGVLEKSGDEFGLTARGEDWAKLVTWTPEFPSAIQAVPQSQSEDSEDELDSDDGVVPPLFSDVWNKLTEDKRSTFDKAKVAALHAGVWAHSQRHFAIFAGLSGSGKTLLARRYARALAELSGSLDAKDRVLVVPVSPGWTDASALFGYVKPLAGEDYETPAFLELLLSCEANPSQIHVAILDEMNLSHPEQYLAPLLSAMELEDKPVVIHNQGAPFDGVPAQLVRYPRNLVLIGTLNMDETTHGVSDKVLDRALTLEFWDVDLDAYPRWNDFQHLGSDLSVVKAVLKALLTQLKSQRLHFGWRVVDDVLRFLDRSRQDGVLSGSDALDWVLYSKVLPKLRGHDTPQLRDVFKQCVAIFGDHQLKQCKAKTVDLLNDLQLKGSARFWR